ncbi:MAG TPA: hypothetical protein VKI45_04585 [Allosphingosinicella sp.]|nr:hypothetical protein [Allosphingosinicella sp.]
MLWGLLLVCLARATLTLRLPLLCFLVLSLTLHDLLDDVRGVVRDDTADCGADRPSGGSAGQRAARVDGGISCILDDARLLLLSVLGLALRLLVLLGRIPLLPLVVLGLLGLLLLRCRRLLRGLLLGKRGRRQGGKRQP